MKNRKPSIKDVAIEAGVSGQTVSNYMNSSAPVHKDTKKRIEKAIKKLHYTPNIFARGLRVGKTNTIGIVIPEIANPFFSAVIDGIEEEASKNNYTIILASSSYNDIKLEAELDKFSNYVDGIIICTHMASDRKIREILKKGVPILAIDIKIDNKIVPSIGVDNYKAIYDGIEYLINFGHENIYYFSEPLNMKIILERFKAYKDCLKDNNIEFDNSKVFTDKRLEIRKTEMGYVIMNEILQNIKIPAAVFGASDLIIIGAMKATLEKGFNIPDDISFMGYDNIYLCDYLNPPLTTIKQPKKNMGKLAFNLMVDILSGKSIKEKQVILKTDLIVRETVKNFKINA